MKPVTGVEFWRMVGESIGLPSNCIGFTITCNNPSELVEVVIRTPLELDENSPLETTTFYLVPAKEYDNADHQ